MATELTEEDVFNDDKDPLEAIRELRKEEGVADDDNELITTSVDQTTSDPAPDASDDGDKDDDLAAFDGDKGDGSTDTDNKSANDDTGTKSGEDKGAAETDSGDNNADGTDDKGDKDDGAKPEGDDTDAGEAPGPITFKANGQEFNFTQEEVMAQFETVFGQAMNYTQKMQAIAPYRKMISALEAEGLSKDQLNIAIDALKGNKEALQEIIKVHGIEAFDLEENDESSPYKPTEYSKDETTLDIEEISGKISSDKEYPITVDIIDKQWDQTSRNAFSSNPNLIMGLHNDVKTGKYDTVAPIAMKMKVLDGNTKSDIEYYMLAGEQVRTQEEAAAEATANAATVDQTNKDTQAAVDKSDAASSEAARKRSASTARTRADRKGVIDYLDDDDEKFDEWYKNLQASN